MVGEPKGCSRSVEARFFLQWRNKRETEEGMRAFGETWPGLEFTLKEVFLISRAGTLTYSPLPESEVPVILSTQAYVRRRRA